MEFIELKNGPALPVQVLALALDLERRGFQLVAEGDTLRVIRPDQDLCLSDQDRASIQKFKLHLLALVVYRA